uniref:Uncharacterized protein n=1 Tax=Gossypium raimondii TaxID=29730 RepID=A0A0D2UDJ3_GOSRA|nr:hypothetical protein B456_010G129200 [Gossypium raimondii]
MDLLRFASCCIVPDPWLGAAEIYTQRRGPVTFQNFNQFWRLTLWPLIPEISTPELLAPYCAPKWAVEGLRRIVAKKMPDGFAVVALSPGVINTEMLQSCFENSTSGYQTPDAWSLKAVTMIILLQQTMVCPSPFDENRAVVFRFSLSRSYDKGL